MKSKFSKLASAALLGAVGLGVFSVGSAWAACVGACGTLGPVGVGTAPPPGGNYTYVTTAGGLPGVGSLPSVGGTNGSEYTTGLFTASAGSMLDFYFNYVTSDGAQYADYAWAQLQGLSNLTLFTARTTT